MLRKKSKAVPEGNGPIPLLGGITREGLLCRVMSETWGKTFQEITEDMRRINQRLASLEQVTRQPRLVMEADVKVDKKIRERTEDAAAAFPKHGDRCSAKRVQTGPKSSTSFGDDFPGPPALSCSRDDALVGKGAAAAKSYLSPLEVRTPTAVGDLLLTGTTSTATGTTFDQSPLWFCLTKEIHLKT